MMQVLKYQDFDSLRGVLIDVRSPSEYKESHIPGALNLPLLNDEHRKIIGTLYKQKGKQAALDEGYRLVDPLRPVILEQLKHLSESSLKLRIYCARGGLRSRLMSEFLLENGYEIGMLHGGYKAYRNQLLQRMASFRRLMILSGYTGVGKTKVLRSLAAEGEQILDLEALARHKGSAFGNLEGVEQPNSAMFHNLIGEQLKIMDPSKRLWLESESYKIGKVDMPGPLWENMKAADGIEIIVPLESRIENILKDYGKADLKLLANAVMNLRRRLGDEDARLLRDKILENDLRPVVTRLLRYYDKSYLEGREKRKCQNFVKIEFDHAEPEKIAGFLLAR